MIINPAIIALLLSSVLISGMMLYASFFGVRILLHWDLHSGSDRQLALERRTYLISTILSFVLAFETASIFLFVHIADSLHQQFVGAMCAAGVLLVDDYGYPTLILKLVSFLLAGLWLIVNHVDNLGHDYPLIRKKYFFLLGLTPLIVTEMVVQGSFFFGLEPDVITSCCGSLFGQGGETVASEIAGLPLAPAVALFSSSLVLTLGSGLYYYRTGRGAWFFGGLSGINFLVLLVSLISFISLYFYELPTHHCPFCILQREYGYIGYPLYLTMLGGAVCGLGVGVLQPFRKVKSLARVLPRVQRRLTLAALLQLLLFAVIVLAKIYVTPFTMRF